jgi:hypothetical protein
MSDNTGNKPQLAPSVFQGDSDCAITKEMKKTLGKANQAIIELMQGIQSGDYT